MSILSGAPVYLTGSGSASRQANWRKQAKTRFDRNDECSRDFSSIRELKHRSDVRGVYFEPESLQTKTMPAKNQIATSNQNVFGSLARHPANAPYSSMSEKAIKQPTIRPAVMR